jgi:hypothetical protein
MRNIRQKAKQLRRKTLPFFLGFWVILIPVVFLIIQNPEKAQAEWIDDRWGYRTMISITNSGAAVTDRKVKLDIQATCADSRFTDAQGNELRYFLDSTNGACNTNSTDYYVLMPNINGTPNPTIIYHYYGNPQATAGTAAAQFSEATFTQSGTSSASEEIGEGPQLYLKLDEHMFRRY